MFEWIFSRYAEFAYVLMRVFFGLLFAAHGAQKLFGVLEGHRAALFTLQFFGGAIEFFGGLAIAVGLFTAPIAFLAAGEMIVAYVMFHLPDGFIPILNRGELAALYFFGFLFISTRGAGRYSLDSIIQKPKNL